MHCIVCLQLPACSPACLPAHVPACLPAVMGTSQPLGAGEASDSKKYAEKATAYGVTLLLIWFTFAGVYCMVSMPFKQDTLLYGRTKSD